MTAKPQDRARRQPLKDIETCPDHGNTLVYHDDQGGEWEVAEHLECCIKGCPYEVWAY